jgi:hypothetical protein
MMKCHVWAATVLATTTFGFSALAQQAAATGEAAAGIGTGTTGSVTAEATAPAPAPAAAAPAVAPAPAPAPAEAAGDSDHDAMVGRLAFGYLGYVNIPFGAFTSENANFSTPAFTAAAPVIGMRLWLNQTLGIDAGLGLTTTFGTHQAPDATGGTVSTNATAPTGLAVHFGMPLALRAAKHYAFEIIPEMNIGYAQASIANAAANTGTDYTGLHVDIGGRAGAELHFGFIGVPELSLVGSVGVRVDMHQTKTEARVGNVTTTVKDSRTIIGTTVGDNPWNIFIGNVSAFYYL